MSDLPPPASRAVFLSYAREDAEAARRIADALRAFGIEVWFDQNELRGGDSWDQKIRGQIRGCALVVPIISAHTQARHEGYFRREWKLAVERTHDMASGVAFIVPVVIDETKEADALVPDEFMHFQWTRLAHGVPSPQFVEQVKKLMEAPVRAPDAGRSRSPVASRAEAGPGSTLPAAKKGPPVALVVSLATVFVAVGVVFFVTRKQDAPGASVVPVEVKPTAPAPEKPRIADKSVAVLPFTNMSEEKDSAFFTDGMHEDILTNLALVRELRVVSRTSVMPYRKTEKPMRQIAQELGVTYILEGSVRRVGNKVRVTGQLIHAASDEHVWAQAYDRDLTDIFAIQSELSRDIAAALKAALSPEEKIMIARRPTDNPDAYDLYLRARDVYNRQGITQAATDERVILLQKAVELDAKFAQAWGELADAYAYAGFTFSPGMDEHLAKAKIAMDRAVQLAPDDTEVLRSLGTYYYYGFRDYARATEQYERLVQRQPNDPTLSYALGLIQRRQGNWAKSLANLRRASELDPANIRYRRTIISSLIAARRYPELQAEQRRLSDLLPGNLEEQARTAIIPFLATGSIREADEFFARLAPAKANSSEGINVRRQWARLKGDWAEAVRLTRLLPYYEDGGETREEQAVGAALDFHALGDREAAKAVVVEYVDDMRQRLAHEPRNARLLSMLSAVEAVLGNKEAALRYADQSVAAMPLSLDALDAVTYEVFRIITCDVVGEKETALAACRRVINLPSGIFALNNVHVLRAASLTLKGDPRFDALLDDPRNNASLF